MCETVKVKFPLGSGLSYILTLLGRKLERKHWKSGKALATVHFIDISDHPLNYRKVDAVVLLHEIARRFNIDFVGLPKIFVTEPEKNPDKSEIVIDFSYIKE